MKRLTETWRQKKTLKKTDEEESVTVLNTGKKRLGMVAVSSTSRTGQIYSKDLPHIPAETNNDQLSYISFMSSFGPDFDEEIISVVNSAEQSYQAHYKEEANEKCELRKNVKRLLQAQMPSKEKSKISQSLQHESRNPGKRKNSRSWMSSKLEPTFKNTGAWQVLSTPTQSPADKRRKEDSLVSVNTKKEESVSLKKSYNMNQGRSAGLLELVKVSALRTPTTVAEDPTSLHRRKRLDCSDDKIEVDMSPEPALANPCTTKCDNMCSSMKINLNNNAEKNILFPNKTNQQTKAELLSKTTKKSGEEHIVEHMEINRISPPGKGKELTKTDEGTLGLETYMSESSMCKQNENIPSIKDFGLHFGEGREQSDLQLKDAPVSAQANQEKASVLSLSAWGLPSPVLAAYKSQGITSMFPWQAQCLTTGSVLAGGNLVYSAPTSAGKTMVAELLMLKRVLEIKRKALFILPFVSVTREKMISLQRLYQDAGIRVGGFMGGYSPAGGFQSVDVAVCTIEKGNSLVNRLMEENRMGELGVVVIDELHLVGDSSRGYLLELLLTKVCFLARKSRENGNQKAVQVIGMSATLPNLDLLAKWLDADLYYTDFRPVPLTEHIKIGPIIYDAKMKIVRELDTRLTFHGDEDQIIPLCLETLLAGHSVLIFCPTKAWCEKMAEKIAREFHPMIKNPTVLAGFTGDTGFVKASEMKRLPVDKEALQNIVEQLGRSAVGVDPMLGQVVMCGVAYHHAGLTFDERDIVEGAFRQGLVKVLVATSTLSSGVNLPARRVIVRSPMFGGHVMDTLTYKQMAGRAGRKGVDTEGECILVCKEREKQASQRLLQEELPRVVSCLSSGTESTELSRSLKRAILEVVVSGVAPTPSDVAKYVDCTLLSASLPSNSGHTDTLISSCLNFLEDNEFVHLTIGKNKENEEVPKYQPTQLGSAVLASSMSPDEGLAVFAELQKARQCFVLSNELHVVYLVTPIYNQEISSNLDWYHFFYLWERLPPDQRSVAKLVGVEEGFLAKAIAGRVPSRTVTQARTVAVHKRFYTALALHELVQEIPLLEVAERYRCNKGQLQSLMQSAATFAGMVTVFCARLGWSNMELLFSQFQQRLTLGITRELCDLVRIPLLTAGMARMLFNAGYQTVTAVAHAQLPDIENLFRKASPFQSNKKQEGETDWDLKQRQRACVWLAGRKGLSALEAAIAIIDEAKALIQDELGVKIRWKNDGESYNESLSESASFLTNEHVSVVEDQLAERTLSSGSFESLSSSSSEKRHKALAILQCPAANSISLTSRRSLERSLPSSGMKTKHGMSQHKSIKRSNGGGCMNQTKRRSPSLGFRCPKPQSSVRETSFYGQKVVSPPICLQRQIQSCPAPLSIQPGEAKSLSGSVEISNKEYKKSNSRALTENSQHSSDRLPGISDKNSTSKKSMDSCSEVYQPQSEQICKSSCSLLSPEGAETEAGNVKDAIKHCYSEPGKDEKEDSTTLEDCFEESFVLDTQTVKLLTGDSSRVSKDSDELCKHEDFGAVVHRRTSQKNTSLGQDEADRKFPNSSNDCQGKVVENKPSTKMKIDASSGLPTSIHANPKADTVSPKKEDSHFYHKISENQPSEDLHIAEGLHPHPSITEQYTDYSCEEWLRLQPNGIVPQKKFIEEEMVSDVLQEKLPSKKEADDRDASCTVDVEEDQSVSLIAASNYDRVACLEERVMEDESHCSDLNSSYQDLGIGHCSGPDHPITTSKSQEELIIVDPVKKEGCSNIRTHVTQCVDYNDQEDIALAMNFSNDSFALLIGNLDVKTSSPLDKNGLKDSAALSEENASCFEDSFTASLMDKLMDNNLTCAQDEHHLRETVSKTVSGEAAGENKAVAMRSVGEGPDFQGQGVTPAKEVLQQTPTLNMYQLTGKIPRRRSDKSGDGSKNTTPQNESDFVPPTPPEEQHSQSTPKLRPRPLRACKNRPLVGASTSQGKALRKCQAKKESQEMMDKNNSKQHQKKQQANSGRHKTPVKSNQYSHSITKCPNNVGNTTQSKINSFNEEDRDATKHTQGKNDFVGLGKQERESDDAIVSQLSTQESFTIIDVCANAKLFATFMAEWKRKKSYAISLACDRKTLIKHPGEGIGGNFVKRARSPVDLEVPPRGMQGIEIPGDDERVLVGLAVSWEQHDAYYISLEEFGNGDDSETAEPRSWNTSHNSKRIMAHYALPVGPQSWPVVQRENHDRSLPDSSTCLDDTMSAPPIDDSIVMEQRTQAVKNILKNTLRQTSPSSVIVYDSKAVYNMLVKTAGAVFGHCRDPKIATWLLDPGGKERSLHGLVTNFLPEDLGLLEGIGGGFGYSSLGLTIANTSSGRMRAAVESIISRRLMDVFWRKLTDDGLDRAFMDIEMPSVITMARMELNGIGFSDEECESQKMMMMARLSSLEDEAYNLVSHPFSLTSAEDIAKILYLELQLPVNGDPNATKPIRTLGPSRRAVGHQKPGFSTSKEVLEKLKSYHPLPAVILEWRRISNALTKQVYPLQKAKEWNMRTAMFRIFGECQLHTATGRVSMSEPNLQNIPKDFEITWPDISGESPSPAFSSVTSKTIHHKTRASNCKLNAVHGAVPQKTLVGNPATAHHMSVSMRHAFVPFPGGVIVAADYSQLELRIIAHLSDDKKLISILNDDGDVFKMIAAQWKHTAPEAVTAEQRQQAKQVCYGMLYGIGAKALGEQLGVDENDAAVFIETFKARYTGLRVYLRKTVEECREKGYVSTISGRRRYLPSITSMNPHARAQAERQAVNTTVQGSAADIVKTAMNKIDQKLMSIFPESKHPHKLNNSVTKDPRGAFLVLQLHDELIYEVSQEDATQVAGIIKEAMEKAASLMVKLPVKVKLGSSWGRLKELEI